ncbi:chemotaxis protein CheW [Geotalea toluenoxydans]
MNLADIRKKAQQEKEALQAALAELTHETADSLDGEDDYPEAYNDPLYDAEAYFEDGESFETDGPIAAADQVSGKGDRSAVMDAGPLSPEDIFPEQMEVMLDAPGIPGKDMSPPSPQAPKTVSAPVIEEKAASSGFDPIRVMLEGRSSAGHDEDAFIGPATNQESDAANSQELLCFKVASEEYALNIMEIKEIIKPREVTEVPRVPAFVSGVLSLRGIIIPIFDMNARLGLSRDGSTGKERIIVVKNGDDGYCGILVDEVVQVVRIEDRLLEPPPTVLEGIDRDFVSGIGRYHGRMLILLNMDKILDITLY